MKESSRPLTCRDVILYKLYDALANCDEGLPPHPDADEEDMLTTPEEINALSDEDLVECFEATIGFWG